MLGGDFTSKISNFDGLEISLAISVFNWILLYLFSIKSIVNGSPRIIIEPSYFVLFIFIVNLFITVIGEVGKIGSTEINKLSILTTIVPISYLFLLISMGDVKNIKYIICAIILLSIDIYRGFIGAFIKILYVGFIRGKINIVYAIITLPVIYYAGVGLLEYKAQSRGLIYAEEKNDLMDKVTARISTISTVEYVISNSEALSKKCSSDEYASQFEAAIISVLPKKILGISSPRTFNNCLIDYFTNSYIENSSVNSPWIINIYLTFLQGFWDLAGYLSLTSVFIFGIIKISNYLFLKNAILINFWVLYEFLQSGNILHLTIPLYFLIVVYGFCKLKKYYIGISKKC
jgi:hypothetical protein